RATRADAVRRLRTRDFSGELKRRDLCFEFAELGPKTLRDGERADGEGAEPLHLDRHRKKLCAALGKLAEPAHVLANRDLAAEQFRMRGTLAGVGAIDVMRVDADEHGARIGEAARQLAGDIRMTFEILVGAPVAVPGRLDENCLAADLRG